MAAPGVELLVSVRRDAVVPALVIGLGGSLTEVLDDVVVVPLPAGPERIEAAMQQLRGAKLLAGADLPAAARLAARLTELPGLELVECNPVLVHPEGAVVVDAVAKEISPMNAIAEQLGEVGLPAPVSELAAKTWDAVIVGGGHNGLTCAAYLAKAGQSVLVLERRERLGGACTLERPFADPDFIVSPCAYVVGLLDDIVIRELQLKQRGLHVHVADPNLWVPFPDGTSFGQWLDDARTQRDLDTLGVSAKDQKGYWAYEHLFDEIRKRLRTGERDTWVGESPSRAELEELLQRRPDDDRRRLRGLDRRGPRRVHGRPAAQGRAVRPGHHRRLGGPARQGHRARSSSCTTRATSRAAARSGATSAAAWG